MPNLSFTFDPSSPEGTEGSSGQATTTHWVIKPSKSNPEYWWPNRNGGPLSHFFSMTRQGIEPTTYQHLSASWFCRPLDHWAACGHSRTQFECVTYDLTSDGFLSTLPSCTECPWADATAVMLNNTSYCLHMCALFPESLYAVMMRGWLTSVLWLKAKQLNSRFPLPHTISIHFVPKSSCIFIKVVPVKTTQRSDSTFLCSEVSSSPQDILG